MPLPAAAVGYAIVSIGGALLRIAEKQLPKYLKRGAKHIKKPSKTQVKNAKKTATPKQAEFLRKRAEGKMEKHREKVSKKSKEKYTPREDQPEGYEDIYDAEAGGESFIPKKVSRPKDKTYPWVIKKSGGVVKKKKRKAKKTVSYNY